MGKRAFNSYQLFVFFLSLFLDLFQHLTVLYALAPFCAHALLESFRKHLDRHDEVACHRQLDQIERSVDVIYHNACGASGVVGQSLLQDWAFAFDIGFGFRLGVVIGTCR